MHYLHSHFVIDTLKKKIKALRVLMEVGEGAVLKIL